MSTATILPLVIILDATCDHPPGVEPMSNKFEFFFIKSNFLFNSINLNAALDL